MNPKIEHQSTIRELIDGLAEIRQYHETYCPLSMSDITDDDRKREKIIFRLQEALAIRLTEARFTP